jgi:hypothetical protein
MNSIGTIKYLAIRSPTERGGEAAQNEGGLQFHAQINPRVPPVVEPALPQG